MTHVFQLKKNISSTFYEHEDSDNVITRRKEGKLVDKSTTVVMRNLLTDTKTRTTSMMPRIQQQNQHKIVEILLVLIQEDILIYFTILICDICGGAHGERDARNINLMNGNTKHLLKMASE